MKSILIATIAGICFCSVTCNGQQKSKAIKTDQDYTFSKASADGIGKFYFGREIAHMMGSAGIPWLDRDERQDEENTNLAISKIEISPSAIIADIGAGTGYYSFKLATKVPQGKVYAVEVQDEMIKQLNERKEKLHINNIEVVKGNAMSPGLPDNSIDLAVMVDVYHELAYPREMLQSIKKALKKNGKILLIEFRGEDPSIPIKKLHKTTVVQVNKEFAANGFSLYYKGDFLPIQHFLLYEKK